MPFEIPTEDDKKYQFVQSRFTKIAEKYDFFNDIVTQGMHRYWKNFLVKQASLNIGDQALDICCGTGDITQRLVQAVGKKGQVVGLDFSEGMLMAAGQRNKKQKTFFLQGDAMALPFRDNAFDAVTVGYGLRNLIDIEICLREVFRVLKPGGRFLSLDMGKVRLPLIKQLFHVYFFNVVPLIGKMIYPKEDLFDYFPVSTLEYPSQESLNDMLLKEGFKETRYYNFSFGATAIHRAVKP
ncbi:MAG: bifunctional demethylmenaquinone methyltransferase/2-methoxy-6-polyprenyl-1,4-benzoquinol methylase UbiE [Deltaproteobacteria bacterium]|nr:bifunctional demethylmenaquinone methyltransferase/2-methoxy-6-polyprenyl-1,4-benzoquinol methylase UbiE [Deltaproteobacteria bacterium]